MDATRPVVPRRAAGRDVEEIVDYLAREAGLDTALRFIEAFEEACDHISTNPAAGSPRFGWELDRPGLRTWPVKGFGYLAFYAEGRDHIDLWRVLHMARDFPTWVRDELLD
ncbi:type II toxin-antitoxin system RelE/ParE family toxin [Seohaeicola zhoushanensis]|uniref:Plasmid stabilization protein n=1 Tax=Seohaeicola zhoushanensis TaxID=1569283 RepID=A0A8J3H233_9RHOB|nr:type II toxin-antitoxin system RelE/ParE family toxin [Seohaeicola zhoushanensis]GHF76108.1 plasmid stabilization protein [Seohaeicola zhoushanensis]